MSEQATPRVTIYQIAKRAGCSAMTVSRALMPKKKVNDRISADTRASIQKLAKEMGYKPNTAARSLILRKTYNVGFHINSSFNYYQHLHMKTLRRLQSKLEEGGYHLGFYFFEANNIRELQHFLKQPRMIDALITLGRCLHPEEAAEIVQSGIPRTSLFAEHEGFHSLLIDDYAGGQLAARFLHSRGFRKVTAIIFNVSNPLWNRRVPGFLEEAARLGIEVHQIQDFTHSIYPFHYAWGHGEVAPDLLVRLRALGEAGRCVFVNSDSFALGLLHYLERLGVRVGEEISILGYDNAEEYGDPLAPPPRLTTISRPRAEIGEHAAQLILSEDVDFRTETFAPSIAIRGSVGHGPAAEV